MNTKYRLFIISILLIFVFTFTACTPQVTTEPTSVPEMEASTDDMAPANPEIILATTTSTRDSGLLDVLLPIFEEQTGYKVKMVAVGTGAALAMGEEGNADVLLVHAPASEEELMAKGFGIQRDLIMHNDFIIVGPADDPAGIKGMTSASEAFVEIDAAKSTFVSRADDSGTNKKELAIWKTADITPEGDWYLESGQGMGDTLRIASEKFGYTLTDRATYLANQASLELDIMVEGDPVLLNIYHVIVVNPEKWPKVNFDGAKAFAAFMTSDSTQKLIGEFGVAEYGAPLFFPDAGKDPASLGL
ncbi:MAG: tungsten ABC transporter substrate-binding protein [Anaerolineaceae bacterium]|nr:tungsten ABC transporter substrate-binding protein [Anaerolineaceae bacterium]